MKRLFQLEQSIGKYGDKLWRTQPSKSAATTQPTNQWIVKEIRTMLDNKMAAHSSNPELNQHFRDLFCGLDKINAPRSAEIGDPLDPKNGEEQILDAFDSRYFRGEASFKFTTSVLADKRVRNVEHFQRAVAQGGMILRSWTAANRELFQLHLANKLWVIGKREESRAKLLADYHSFWRERLAHSDIPSADLRLIALALVNTRTLPINQLVSDVATNWRSAFVIWQIAFPHRIETELDPSDSLWEPLNHIAHTAAQVPLSLQFVPLNMSIARQQITRALARYAEATNDRDLLDKWLHEQNSEIEDIAAKLALA